MPEQNTQQMPELIKDDLNYVVSRLPKFVHMALKARSGRYLAGGFIRALIAGEEANGIDLFADSKDHATAFAVEMADSVKAQRHSTDNAITIFGDHIKTPVQVITRWTFEDVETLRSSFDFSIARAVIWWEGGAWHSSCDPTFYADLASKRLRYLAPDRDEEAGGSFLRMQKFLRRGYKISPEESGKVVARLMKPVRTDDWATMDEEYRGRVVASFLREVDPNYIRDGEVFEDEGEEIPQEAHHPANRPVEL